MIKVKYIGTNLYTIGGYNKIGSYKFEQNKETEVKDEDLWSLMLCEPFAYRVHNNILQVPRDFPLQKPKAIEAPKEKEEEKHEEKEEDSLPHENLLPLRTVLKTIEESEDKKYLLEIYDMDTREKVKLAVMNRLEKLDKK